jgi:type II secretory pathway predicted ATPase ExeA
MADPPTQHLVLDPFAITPDALVYVPRESTDRARQKLLDSVRNPRKGTALIGPRGLGKSLLLQMLVAQVREEMESVYLPYAAVPPHELGAWVLRLLGAPAGDDPAVALRAFCHQLVERKSALLIAIDEVVAMPDDTAQWVGSLMADSGGAFRLLIAASDDARSSRTIAAIGASFNVVFLTQPMSERETAHYIEQRLRMAQIPDSIRLRFDAPMVGKLHRDSDGIPRNLHTAAAALLRGLPSETRSVIIEPDPVLESLIEAQMVSPRSAVEPIATSAEDSSGAMETILPPHPVRRIEPPPSRTRVLLGALMVAGISIAIPLIRSLLPEPAQPPTVAAEVPAIVEAVDPSSAAMSEAIAAAVLPEPAPPAAPIDTALLGPFRVQVNATPWARVRVDGIDFGETPLANIPLLAGPHTFQVLMSDGRVIERVVEIDAEKRFVGFE